MKSKDTIVAAIDFSHSSPLVLRHALKAAEAGGANLVAVHVLDESRMEFIASSRSGKPDYGLLESQAKEKFERLSGGAEGILFRVESGKPAEAIARVLEETSASLLVIGANDLTKRRLGAVAARCVRAAPCDVLILRDWQGSAFSKIVVCNDFSQTASKGIGLGAAIAAIEGATLQVVTVIYPPGLDSWGATLEHRADSDLSYSEECHVRANARMQESLDPHRGALAGIKWETLVLEAESSSSAITEHVSKVSADLVILGTRGHSKLASYFLGTNAERLLQDLPVSVLAVR